MAKSTNLNFPQTLSRGAITLVAADTTTLKDLIVAGADDSIVKSINAVSDDTAAVNLRVFLHDGTTAFQIATVNIPIASGTNGTAAAVDVLNSIPSLPFDSNGKRCILLPAGSKIQVAALATVTAAKTVTIVAQAENY